MIALLSLPTLEVRTASDVLSRAGVQVVGPSGEAVATVIERSGALRTLGRVLSRSPGGGAADFEVRDADGSHVLTIAKHEVGFSGRTLVDVALADGTPVGSGSGRSGARGSAFELLDPSGSRCGTMRDPRGQQYELRDAGGAEVGQLHRWLMSGHGRLPDGAARAYRVSFTEGATVPLRALALGLLIGLDHRLT